MSVTTSTDAPSAHYSPHLTGTDFQVFGIETPRIEPPHTVNATPYQAATTMSQQSYVNVSMQTDSPTGPTYANAYTQTGDNFPTLYFQLPHNRTMVAPTYPIHHPFVTELSPLSQRRLLTSLYMWPQIVMHNSGGIPLPDVLTASRLGLNPHQAIPAPYANANQIWASFYNFRRNNPGPTGFTMRKVNGERVLSYDPSVIPTQAARHR
jgi:hypothetical protein